MRKVKKVISTRKALGERSLKSLEPRRFRENLFLLPLIAQLIDRHISRVRDKNSLDRVFDSALAKRHFLPEKLLLKFAQDYTAIPSSQKKELFGDRTFPKLKPISIQEARAALFGWKIPSIEIKPVINSILPIEPTYGFVAGQQLTLKGNGYSPVEGKNKIEIWILDPDGYQLISTLFPTGYSPMELTFVLPNDISPGSYHLRVVVEDTGQTEYFFFKICAPEILISSITPQNQQPGSWILITGDKFKSDGYYTIRFVQQDLAETPPAIDVDALTLQSQPLSQIRVQIPNDVIPGNNLIQIFSKDAITPPSDCFQYSVGTPKYRAVFSRMHCSDETNWADTEWGEDEVFTLWAVTADGTVWSKKSNKAYDFDEEDKPNHVYEPDDAKVLTPEGQFSEVKYGLAIMTGLYETDEDDLKVATGIIGVAGEVAGAIISGLGGGAAGKEATKAIAAGLSALVNWLFNDEVTVGLNPNDLEHHPGPITIFKTSPELQNMLVGPNTTTDEIMLDFHGDGDHGWYQVWYKFLRG